MLWLSLETGGSVLPILSMRKDPFSFVNLVLPAQIELPQDILNIQQILHITIRLHSRVQHRTIDRVAQDPIVERGGGA